jgi:AraC-like DNA-binding protein
MDSAPPDFRLLRFGSSEYPVNVRVAAWQEVLAQKLVTVNVEQLSNQPFQIDASLRILPEFRFGIALSAAFVFRRTQALTSVDNDDILLLVSMEGVCKVTTAAEEMMLDEGEGYFMPCTQEGSFTSNSPTRILCARFKRAKLSALVGDLDDVTSRVVPRDTESLRLLTIYLRGLDDNQQLATPELRNLVTTQVYELAALVLNSTGAALPKPQSSGHGTVWPRVIKKYIAEHLDKQDLSIADVATAHRLSPRHVQRVLESDGTTFSEFVLAKRLERTHLALCDSRQAHRGISEIALSSGFGDVSYFNRAFRRRYGASPSEVRTKNLLRAIPGN